MIGPFSTTLVPLSSSSSVDRQVLINVEASAISPDERTFGFIFTKIPFTRRSDEEKKGSRSLDQIARTFSLFAPPPTFFSTSRHCFWYTNFTNITYYILYSGCLNREALCLCGYSDLAPRDISGTSDPFTRIIYNNLSAETSVRSSVSIHTVTRDYRLQNRQNTPLKHAQNIDRTGQNQPFGCSFHFPPPYIGAAWFEKKIQNLVIFQINNELHAPCLLCLFVGLQNVWLYINMTIK